MTAQWEALVEKIESGNAEELKALLDELGPAETARAISRLPKED